MGTLWLTARSNTLADNTQPFASDKVMVDTKAMRKVKSADTLVLAGEALNVTGTIVTELAFDLRVLIGS